MAEDKVAQDAEKAADKSKDGQGSNDDEAQGKAARMIQSNYRGYRARRELQGMGMDATSRWSEALKNMKLDDAREQQLGKKQASGGKSDAVNRWKRGGVLVGQIAGSPGCGGSGGGSGGGKDEIKGSDPASAGPIGTDGPVEGGPSLHGDEAGQEQQGAASPGGPPSKEASRGMIGDVPGGNDGEKIDNVKRIAKPNQHGLRLIEWWTRGAAAQDLSKTMEAVQWLEMVDKKHRYGSNLKPYHATWSDADTKENFFVWLDEGGGKDLDLDDCPRERLESERVTYLTAEQRLNYVVDIKEGKLYWRRNGKPIDTTKGKFKDLGDGQGIVELGPEEQAEEERIKRERLAQRRASSDSVSSFSSDSSFESAMSDEEKREAKHYGAELSKRRRRIGMLTSKGWMDALLRKTVQGNTWIYVLNSRRELYVGIKQTGKFQHSSFLSGGRVLSAGLLKAKDGTLTSLSPLSGHYRAGTAHFRHFVQLLQQEDVDLEHVTLSKSLLLLRGMEAYGSIVKKKKDKKKGKGDDNGDGPDITVSKLVTKKSTREAAKEKLRGGKSQGSDAKEAAPDGSDDKVEGAKAAGGESEGDAQDTRAAGDDAQAAPSLALGSGGERSGNVPSDGKPKTLLERIRSDGGGPGGAAKEGSAAAKPDEDTYSAPAKSGFGRMMDKIFHSSSSKTDDAKQTAP
ncbi:unnamed protein product [Parajaminaea phylloscopi]